MMDVFVKLWEKGSYLEERMCCMRIRMQDSCGMLLVLGLGNLEANSEITIN